MDPAYDFYDSYDCLENFDDMIFFLEIFIKEQLFLISWIWYFSQKKQQHTNLGGLFREIFIWKFPAEISLIRFPDKVRIDFINLFYFLVQRCDWFCDITELWFEILDNFWLVVDF